jgi:hypothetical protein
MTRLIESFGADFVANDRTFITPNLVGHPLPLSVRLGRGTILSSRSLQRFVRRRSLHRPNPRLDELPAGFAARQKIELTPREFATAVGTSTSAGFLLRAVVVADLDLACQGATLLRLATDETLAELERVCFTPDHHQWLEPIFGDRPPGAGGATERFLVRLTETVPAYRLRYGPAFPSDEDRDMLASLLGLVQT